MITDRFATLPHNRNTLRNLDILCGISYTNLIVTGVEFNERGLADHTLDPLGRQTKYFYDDMNRRIAVVENYVDAEITWDTDRWAATNLDDDFPDEDRVTSYVYDGAGHVLRQVAHAPDTSGEKVQVTQYVYDVSIGGGGPTVPTDSLVESGDLVSEVIYPDESTGEPGSGNTYKVRYAYNIQGELRSMIDQNGTVHVYSRDDLGRVTRDAVPTLGSGIDGWARRIDVSFDSFGRTQELQTADAASGGNVKNAVKFDYTNLWQIDKIDQDPSGVLEYTIGGDPTNDTERVSYVYSNAVPASGTSGSNYSRPTELKIPSNSSPITTQHYGYGTSGTIDERISRVARSLYSNSVQVEFLKYQYIGMGMIAEADYSNADVSLDFTLNAAGQRRTQGFTTGTSGEYPGYDRFGRTIRLTWADGGLTTSSGNPTRPQAFAEGYTYDSASNRLTRTDLRPGASWADRDFEYIYDDLDRLGEAKRGTRNGGATWTAGKLSQKWALDMMGNWTDVKTDNDADGAYTTSGETQDRSHNQANEFISIGSGMLAVPLSYDDAGNLASKSTTTYVHDAWNRLIRVRASTGGGSPPTYGEYEYNGLHWRTVARADTDTTPNGVPDQQRLMYYDASWRIVEERVDDDYVNNAGENKSIQQLWGLRYVDDAALRRVRTNGGAAQNYYHLTDAMFSTRAIVGSSGRIQERVNYSAYGVARHYWAGDVDGDADVDGTDTSIVTALAAGGGTPITNVNYKAECDINRDGNINSTDTTLVGSSKTALPGGWIGDSASADNLFGFTGYVFAKEIDTYCVRFRWYNSQFGRWLERDPAGFSDGLNLYEYVKSQATGLYDPMGLKGRQPKYRYPVKPSGVFDTIRKPNGDRYTLEEVIWRPEMCETARANLRDARQKLFNIQMSMMWHGCGTSNSAAAGSWRPRAEAIAYNMNTSNLNSMFGLLLDETLKSQNWLQGKYASRLCGGAAGGVMNVGLDLIANKDLRREMDTEVIVGSACRGLGAGITFTYIATAACGLNPASAGAILIIYTGPIAADLVADLSVATVAWYNSEDPNEARLDHCNKLRAAAVDYARIAKEGKDYMKAFCKDNCELCPKKLK